MRKRESNGCGHIRFHKSYIGITSKGKTPDQNIRSVL